LAYSNTFRAINSDVIMARPRPGVRVRWPAMMLLLAGGVAAPAYAQAASDSAVRVNVAHLRVDVPPPDPQSAPPQSSPVRKTPRVLRWTIELHGGYFGSWTPTGGFGAVPTSGTDFATANSAVSPSASSWFFGRGASWLNVYAKPGTSSQVLPLDAVL